MLKSQQFIIFTAQLCHLKKGRVRGLLIFWRWKSFKSNFAVFKCLQKKSADLFSLKDYLMATFAFFSSYLVCPRDYWYLLIIGFKHHLHFFLLQVWHWDNIKSFGLDRSFWLPVSRTLITLLYITRPHLILTLELFFHQTCSQNKPGSTVMGILGTSTILYSTTSTIFIFIFHLVLYDTELK